jgi:hypothetical protein
MTNDHERPTGWTSADPAIGADQLAKQCPPTAPFLEGVQFLDAIIMRAWAQPEGNVWRPYVEVRTVADGDDYVWKAPRTFDSWDAALWWLAGNVDAV